MTKSFLWPLGVTALFLLLSISPAAPASASDQNQEEPIQANSELAVATANLTTTPTEPIKRDANQRYFNYGGQTVALVGISGETIPHLNLAGNYPNGTNPRSSYCVFNLLPGSTTKRKYQECLDKMVADGLNLIRLWVNFNQRPTPVSDPDVQVTAPNHYPFKYYDGSGAGKFCPNDPSRTGWNLEEKNTTFFANLRTVVRDAQSRGVIVELTLFIPADSDAAQEGPWWSSNNCQNKGFRNPSSHAEDVAYFHQADNTANDPFTAADLDQDADNKYMRSTQVRVVQWLVDELSTYSDNFNFFFELANEADLSGTSLGSFTPMINWHHYLARRLYDYETGKGRHHLIAANVSAKPVVDALLTNSKIDIVNSHYVRLIGDEPGVLEADRNSAINLLFKYNTYTSTGVQGPNNKAIWGFNETHITGLGSGNLKAVPDSTRAEAWQFLIDGGGQYDHLSYCWGNTASLTGTQGTCPTSNAEDPDSLAARQQLGYLSRFLGTLPLNGMHRSTTNQTSFWLNTPGKNTIGCDSGGSNFCWAAVEGGTRAAYFHHSTTTASGGFRRYDPIKKASCPASCLTSCTPTCLSNCYRESITVKNLGDFGTCTATFKAEWFTPDGTYKDTAGNLTPIPGATATLSATGSGQQFPLTVPCHAYDLALKVTQTGFCP